jgi:predicted RNA-binding protein Jag
MTNDGTTGIVEFLDRFAAALGIKTAVDVSETPNGPRLNLAGEEAEILVRHRGEPLKALQHVVDMAFGRTLPDERRVFVDALGIARARISSSNRWRSSLPRRSNRPASINSSAP